MVILYDLNNVQYLKIIDYLYGKCDTIAFALPNYKAKHHSTKLIETIDTKKLEITQLDPKDVDRNNEDFVKYKKNVSPLLNELSDNIREIYTATNYFGELRGYDVETYVYTFNEAVLKTLKKYEDLSVWRYPNLPEDLVFYNEIYLVASAVTHENEIAIHDNSQELFDIIEETNISFLCFDD